MIDQAVAQPQRRAKIYLLTIIACFLLPLAIAWWLVGLWQPAPTGQHGELLNPARPLPETAIQTLDLQERWTLAYIGDATCSETCRTSLYDMRQVRLALGKDITRIHTVYMTASAPNTKLQTWLESEHASMGAAIIDAELQTFFEQAFADHDRHSIYLLDPLGNLLMRYPTGVNPSGILKDLKRLLKLSKIG